MKINVLIIIDTKIIGGPGKGIFQLLKYSHDKKVNYCICTIKYRNQKTNEFIEYALNNKIKLALLKQSFFFDIKPIFQLFEIIKNNEFNIVQSHGYKSHLLAYLVSKIYGLKWISFSHGFTTEDLKVQMYHKLDSILLRYSDHAVAVSPQIYAQLKTIRKNTKHTSLIFNAIESAEYSNENKTQEIIKKLNVKNTEIIMGVIGRLSKEKGHIYLIESINKVKTQLKNIRVLIIGDGTEEQYLKRKVNEYELADKVLFLNYQNEIGAYYKIIDLLLLPSLSEGLPNVVLEAMSNSIPVLATNVGAVNQIIDNGKNGWIIEPKDINKLAECLVKLSSNKSLLENIGLKAKNSLYPKFSPYDRADKIVNIYNQCLVNNL